ncbi:MAG: hypothetical protein ACK44Z_10070, partial [Pirellulaceae bacterium]
MHFLGSHHRQMVDERVGDRSKSSTAWPRWLQKRWHAFYVATIARWWMSGLEIVRSHPPRGRDGYRRGG